MFQDTFGSLDAFRTFDLASDALDALKKIDESVSGITILLDLKMEPMDGWAFLKELDSLTIQTKVEVYIVSSSIDIADRKKADECAIVRDFISKPIDKSFYQKLSS